MNNSPLYLITNIRLKPLLYDIHKPESFLKIRPIKFSEILIDKQITQSRPKDLILLNKKKNLFQPQRKKKRK